MSFFNYQKATEIYLDNPFMLEIISCLKEMELYHLLRDGDGAAEFKTLCLASATDYEKWLSVCNGGLLFSTTLLSCTAYDEEIDESFSTIQEWNTVQKHNLLHLPKEFTIIALLNCGNPVCLSETDSKIYLWNRAENMFTTIWDNLADFLANEYITAVAMVEDNALEPIPLKLSEEQDGQQTDIYNNIQTWIQKGMI